MAPPLGDNRAQHNTTVPETPHTWVALIHVLKSDLISVSLTSYPRHQWCWVVNIQQKLVFHLCTERMKKDQSMSEMDISIFSTLSKAHTLHLTAVQTMSKPYKRTFWQCIIFMCLTMCSWLGDLMNSRWEMQLNYTRLLMLKIHHWYCLFIKCLSVFLLYCPLTYMHVVIDYICCMFLPHWIQGDFKRNMVCIFQHEFIIL